MLKRTLPLLHTSRTIPGCQPHLRPQGKPLQLALDLHHLAPRESQDPKRRPRPPKRPWLYRRAFELCARNLGLCAGEASRIDRTLTAALRQHRLRGALPPAAKAESRVRIVQRGSRRLQEALALLLEASAEACVMRALVINPGRLAGDREGRQQICKVRDVLRESRPVVEGKGGAKAKARSDEEAWRLYRAVVWAVPLARFAARSKARRMWLERAARWTLTAGAIRIEHGLRAVELETEKLEKALKAFDGRLRQLRKRKALAASAFSGWAGCDAMERPSGSQARDDGGGDLAAGRQYVSSEMRRIGGTA